MFKQHDSRRAPTWDQSDPARAARLHGDTDLDRETYTRAGFQPVECRACGTCASVRKNSEKHTSIQWTAGSDRACPVLTDWRAGGERPQGEDTCPRMLASIRYAFAEGLIALADGVDPADTDHMVNPLYVPE
ncbi:hypothetical protein CEY15_13060 [Dietzia natronolimnaea]|uniref:Ferredoxin n=1 Tax=Dietzia natronolimnaea TaxID=161920 RepID=A0A2A2WMT2_9ACTN|nr:hypothetical protein [Dietzia natronolimnaea]PAY22465.1 hypothetical protein CEY15_13060 [Dietzia natronolimnaea]